MRIINSSKDITTLEVGDKVVFGNLKYVVTKYTYSGRYYLRSDEKPSNDIIFINLKIDKDNFIKNLGIHANCNGDFPETKSLEALTAIVSALFKEYEKQNELPKTWEEFCERNPIICGESCICPTSEISELDICERDSIEDKNVCTSAQEAEAFLALMQLRQLRKAYVKDWEPKLDKESYYGIIFTKHGISIGVFCDVNRHLSFPTHELAEQFLNNFKDFLEVAKPLL